jgi:hypothetical protein
MQFQIPMRPLAWPTLRPFFPSFAVKGFNRKVREGFAKSAKKCKTSNHTATGRGPTLVRMDVADRRLIAESCLQ